MAIEINKPGKDTINPPMIRIEGRKITNGVRGARAEDIFDDQQIVQNGLSFTRRDEVIYDGEIVVTLVPDQEFAPSGYTGYNEVKPYGDSPDATTNILGKNKEGLGKNAKSNTYYALNGKDPVRTKSNLYTGPFTIRRNTAGDNVVLKVRTYAQGHWSKVRTVELRIVGRSTNYI